MFCTVQIGSGSEKKLPTQGITLLTQPRFEPGIFLVKSRPHQYTTVSGYIALFPKITDFYFI
jgi:hypothetical protein